MYSLFQTAAVRKGRVKDSNGPVNSYTTGNYSINHLSFPSFSSDPREDLSFQTLKGQYRRVDLRPGGGVHPH
jgi:hypothetical protein